MQSTDSMQSLSNYQGHYSQNLSQKFHNSYVNAKDPAVHYNGMHQPSQVTLLGGKKPFVFPLPGVGGGVQSPSHI